MKLDLALYPSVNYSKLLLYAVGEAYCSSAPDDLVLSRIAVLTLVVGVLMC